jgi:murein DD-endopeptidase MepM/ murein hydrolase activator NlpD
VTERKQELLKVEADALDKTIDSLAKQLEYNKQIYAEAVRVAYRNYRTQRTTTYLFSSTDLSDATRRMVNIRHVAEQRQELADRIVDQTLRLKGMRTELTSRRTELDSIERSLEREHSELKRDREEAKRTFEELSEKERKALEEQKRQQQQLDKATKELRKLTEGNKVGKTFNKSTKALNLPVKGGKTEKMQTNMVKIIGAKGDAVNSIYEGKVIRIVVDNTNHSTVMIAHGSYVSVYTHLSQIRVAVGDVVKRNEQIGTIGIGVDHKGVMSAYMQFMIINTESNVPMNVMDCFKK